MKNAFVLWICNRERWQIGMNESGSVGASGTFVVRILNRQNATWQGVITRVDRKDERPFRSLLELIKLIDSTFEEEDESTRSERE
jgi:hypothetical protein